jgi:hypothetical protein
MLMIFDNYFGLLKYKRPKRGWEAVGFFINPERLVVVGWAARNIDRAFPVCNGVMRMYTRVQGKDMGIQDGQHTTSIRVGGLRHHR